MRARSGAATRPSPWSALLEALHSALIDEITESHPETKPELGLPLRQNRFAIPSPRIEQLVVVEVAFTGSLPGDSRGIALLASQRGFMSAVALKPPQLWEAVLRRAATEFERRGIHPIFSPASEFRATDAFPASTLRCARVIWIPFRLPAGEYFLGVGV